MVNPFNFLDQIPSSIPNTPNLGPAMSGPIRSKTVPNGLGECQVFKNLELNEKVIDVASVMGKSTGLAVVDCSASYETVGVLTRVVDLGCCIVLANKKPLTSTMAHIFFQFFLASLQKLVEAAH
ncbi:hypothetical protein Ddye_032600 [Dipteronia dyeriana]|uniref:Uncharacterized protein n=1 Tax=Dipteronia dyeriana TaxID=168575 RepID=A0AAD9WKS9_9ROSI|nr:hypothetical protein Ddye_032600 [Dipteronia dyeriana]